jgi:hypothetical protein
MGSIKVGRGKGPKKKKKKPFGGPDLPYTFNHGTHGTSGVVVG